MVLSSIFQGYSAQRAFGYMTILLFVSILVTGCALPNMYRANIRQGNYIDDTRISKLKVGMTKNEVRRLMGTPLINDQFHVNRWDYVYSFYANGVDLSESKQVTLIFDGDILERIEQGSNAL